MLRQRQILESVCYMVPVNLMHDRFGAYFIIGCKGSTIIFGARSYRFLVKVRRGPQDIFLQGTNVRGWINYILNFLERLSKRPIGRKFQSRFFVYLRLLQAGSLKHAPVALYFIAFSLAGIKLCQR